MAPEQPFVAIGDIHGRDDLLSALLDQLRDQAPELPLVFVGDYVDRGPDSAAVLRRIMGLCQSAPQKVIALKGNHEVMLLDFIDTPEVAGPLWLRNGGAKTLESFGIPDPADNADALRGARDALVEQAGPGCIDWLRARPLIWQSGNVVVSHAGGDPARPIDPRRGHGLLWGHRAFLRKPRRDGLWMVHGHFIVPEPHMRAGRIAIDTGAYSTGRLSAAIVGPEGARFLST